MSAARRVDGRACRWLPVVGGRPPAFRSSTARSARYVNLDYAASSPALASVATHVTEVLPLYASVHRGAGYASQVSTAAYEHARQVVGDFVGARQDDLVDLHPQHDGLARTCSPPSSPARRWSSTSSITPTCFPG